MGGHLSPHTPSDPVARSKGGSIQRPVGERDGARVHAALRTEGPSTAGLRQAMGDTPLKHFWHTARTGGPAGGGSAEHGWHWSPSLRPVSVRAGPLPARGDVFAWLVSGRDAEGIGPRAINKNDPAAVRSRDGT